MVIGTDQIYWNNAPMTKRKYERERDLTREGNVWEGIYYTNFPDNLKNLFPMYGTQDMDTDMENKLELRKPMVAYMLRKNNWWSVPLDGWEDVGTGKYLGPDSGDVIMYEKFLGIGDYIINNNSSFYLFTKGNNLQAF